LDYKGREGKLIESKVGSDGVKGEKKKSWAIDGQTTYGGEDVLFLSQGKPARRVGKRDCRGKKSTTWEEAFYREGNHCYKDSPRGTAPKRGSVSTQKRN